MGLQSRPSRGRLEWGWATRKTSDTRLASTHRRHRRRHPWPGQPSCTSLERLGGPGTVALGAVEHTDLDLDAVLHSRLHFVAVRLELPADSAQTIPHHRHELFVGLLLRLSLDWFIDSVNE